MFHDKRFSDRIKNTPHCQQFAIDSGHWFMIDQAELTLRYISQFLDSNSNKNGSSNDLGR